LIFNQQLACYFKIASFESVIESEKYCIASSAPARP
jgi:hypothetical protein